MPCRFSVASWNVEHFSSSTAKAAERVDNVVDFIKGKNKGPKPEHHGH